MVNKARMVQPFEMPRRDNNGTDKSNIQSQGLNHHVETTEFDAIGQHVGLISIVVSTPHCGCGNPSSILGLDTMLRKASVARVNRRLRRYYLIVRLLPNVFVLACLSLGSI